MSYCMMECELCRPGQLFISSFWWLLEIIFSSIYSLLFLWRDLLIIRYGILLLPVWITTFCFHYLLYSLCYEHSQEFQNKPAAAVVPPATLSFTAGYFSPGQRKNLKQLDVPHRIQANTVFPPCTISPIPPATFLPLPPTSYHSETTAYIHDQALPC